VVDTFVHMPTIEVFADVSCAFTHFGLRHLVDQRSARGLDFRIVVRAWPLELVNGHPVDPAAVARQVAAFRNSIAPDLFVGFDQSVLPHTTIPALGLVAAGYEAGAESGEAVSLALRDELFEQGRDIADPHVLAEVGARFGVVPPPHDIAESAVRADWSLGQRREVVGSPHFFTPDGEGVFCPSLEITKGEGGPRIEYRAEAVDAFLAHLAD